VLLNHVPEIEGATAIKVKSGEEHKNIETCSELWENLLKLHADRSVTLVNLGGGVITDMGGFVASTFKRGIRFVNIPTTLIGQVDAAIGGKTGVNIYGLKNQVGLFADPEAVFIIPSMILTLDSRFMLSGFAEMIKHALIVDSQYWKTIREKPFNEIDKWEDLIIRSVEIKNRVASNDPMEKSLRKRLNFGHTIGHAFETLAMLKKDKSLTHGNAVAMGILCETYLSYKTRGLSVDAMEEIMEYLLMNFLYYKIRPEDHIRIINVLKHDKKNYDKKINFTLIPSIGNARIDQWCEEELIKECLDFYAELE
jgi:3-dehydroquinate synthase